MDKPGEDERSHTGALERHALRDVNSMPIWSCVAIRKLVHQGEPVGVEIIRRSQHQFAIGKRAYDVLMMPPMLVELSLNIIAALFPAPVGTPRRPMLLETCIPLPRARAHGLWPRMSASACRPLPNKRHKPPPDPPRIILIALQPLPQRLLLDADPHCKAERNQRDYRQAPPGAENERRGGDI